MPQVALVITGVVAIVALLVIIVLFIGNILFSQRVKKEIIELLNNKENTDKIITNADMAGLPPCVQKWLKNSRVIGKERIRTVRLKQKGFMRLEEGKPWMPAEAEQYFAVDEPGFIWKVKVKMAPLLYFAGRDKYAEGKGNMLIKLLSLVTVVDARGKELDQGTLLRYLAETVWFPTAALNSYIKWEEIDSNSARATMSYGGVTASGVFIFDEKGDFIDFVTERYMKLNGQYVLETWSTPVKSYKEFNGIRIPNKGEAVWNLKTGDFSWYQVEITEIEYNKPVVY